MAFVDLDVSGNFDDFLKAPKLGLHYFVCKRLINYRPSNLDQFLVPMHNFLLILITHQHLILLLYYFSKTARAQMWVPSHTTFSERKYIKLYGSVFFKSDWTLNSAEIIDWPCLGVHDVCPVSLFTHFIKDIESLGMTLCHFAIIEMKI